MCSFDRYEGCARAVGVLALEPIHGGLDVDQGVVADAFAVDVVDVVVARYGHGPPDVYAFLQPILELRHTDHRRDSGGGMLKTCGLWTSAPVDQPRTGLNFR